LKPPARWSAALCSLLTVLMLAAGARAADPVSVQADGFSFWDGNRLFMAEGHVRLRYRDAVITADTMQYDADTGLVVFAGNVVFVEGEQELAGARLQYDLNTGEAVLDELDAIMYAEGVDGPMFVRGDRVDATPERLRIQRARLTTCECEEGRVPAYHFAAREIEIFPGDRIVVRGVVFYEHGVPLMYLPSWTLSLREGASHFDAPQIGYSSRTGWYIKTTYHYVRPSGTYGALLLDYYQLLGPGAGVRHTYRHDDTGRGTVLIYGVGNTSGGLDASLGWEREWQLDRWRLDANVGYDVSTGLSGAVERQEAQAKLDLEQTSGPGVTRGQLEYQAVKGQDPLVHLAGSGELRRSLGGNWDVYLRAEGYRYETASYLRRWFGYDAELRRRTANYTLTIRLEQQVNPDLKDEDTQVVVPWTHVSRLPEVTLETRAIAGLELMAGVARLKEEPNGTEAWRAEARAGVPIRTLRLSDNAVVSARGQLAGRTYSTGHRQLSLETRTTLNWQLTKPLGLTLQHTYRDGWGGTPFRFDEVTPTSALSVRLSWRNARVTASVSGRYDLRTERWDPLALNATFRLTTNLTVRGAASYDLATHSWQRLVATMDWKPSEGWTVRLGGQYHVAAKQLERVDAQLEMAFGGGWKAGLTAIYSVTTGSFPRSEIFIAHDEECREIRVRYDHTQGEVWLEYNITAFPMSRVAVGAAEDKLMFESDALTELLGL